MNERSRNNGFQYWQEQFLSTVRTLTIRKKLLIPIMVKPTEKLFICQEFRKQSVDFDAKKLYYKFWCLRREVLKSESNAPDTEK